MNTPKRNVCRRPKTNRTGAGLILLFLLTLYSGIRLHIEGEGGCHEAYHRAAVLHTVAGAALLLLTARHVYRHRGWYGSLRKGIGHKSRVTLSLSALFLAATLTGLQPLLFMQGPETCWGRLHYLLGIA